MDFTIQLSIQEIVKDFESMLRLDERLKSKLDLEECTEEDVCKYHKELTRLVKKYIPNYTKHMDVEDDGSFEASLAIYEMLYGNFKEIFYHLV